MPDPSFSRKLLKGYFFSLIVLVSIGIVLDIFSVIDNILGFLGFWLVIFEFFIGTAAASQMGTYTTLLAIQSRGDTAKLGGTFFEERVKEEEQSVRKPWFIMLVINSLIYLLIAILLMNS